MNIQEDRISSKQNPKIKHVLELQKPSARNAFQQFVVEGEKEIEKMFSSNFEAEDVFYCQEIASEELLNKFRIQTPKAKWFPITKMVFEKLAYRENSTGIVVVGRKNAHKLQNLRLRENALVLVLEAIEKPGNLGAIYRTADAAGIDAIVLANPLGDLYNPNAIRSSLGCVFTIPTAIASTTETVLWLKAQNFQILSTYLEASIPYHLADFNKPTAIVMGTEATGISQEWIEASDQNIIIPMQGFADSLNVSTATAIVLFEALRQRMK